MDNARVTRVATRLAQARTESGLTLGAVGRALNMEGATIARYEGGSRVPPVDVFLRLADFYGRPAGWFLGEMTENDITDLTGGVDPVLLSTARTIPLPVQRAIAAHLPDLVKLIDRVCGPEDDRTPRPLR